MPLIEELQGMETRRLEEYARELGIDAEGLDRDELIDEIALAQQSSRDGDAESIDPMLDELADDGMDGRA